MILVRCFAVVWGLMVIGFITMMVAFPAIIRQIPESGTVWGDLIAVAMFFSILPFPAIGIVPALKTLSVDALWRSLAWTFPVALALFLTNADNRALIESDAMAALGGQMILTFIGWIYVLVILGGLQPKGMLRRSSTLS